MSAIAQLKAVLGIDNAQYKAGVRDSEKATKGFQNSIATAGKSLAAAFSVGAVARFTKEIIDFASEIRHAADNMEVSTETLQAINAMALRYGVSIDLVSRALSKMLIAQDGATKGEKIYTDALDSLNIEHEKFARLDPAGALEEVGRAYAGAANQSEAFAAVADLLGQRIGPRLTAMMKDLGKEGLQLQKDKALDAGLIISDETITRLELAGTKLDQLKLKLKAFYAELVTPESEKGIQLPPGILGEAEGIGLFDKPEAKPEPVVETPTQKKDRMAKEADARASYEEKKYLRDLERAKPVDRLQMLQDELAATEGVKGQWTAEESYAMEYKRWAIIDDIAKTEKEIADLKQKQADEQDRINKKLSDAQDRYRERQSTTRGEGQSTDQLSQIGGFVGTSRGNLGLIDRQLEIAMDANKQREEMKRIASDSYAVLQQARDTIAEIRDNTAKDTL